MDKWIERALATWYPETHELHHDPLHPAMGLAGEAGELLDVWKKHNFKKGYDAWECIKCGSVMHRTIGGRQKVVTCQDWTPIILDEIGDLTYYARILYYQAGKLEFPELTIVPKGLEILDALIDISGHAISILSKVRNGIRQENNDRWIDAESLDSIWRYVLLLRYLLDVDLKTILEMNWQKLKGGDNNGWKETLEDVYP